VNERDKRATQRQTKELNVVRFFKVSFMEEYGRSGCTAKYI
jgi:hypothetical protein